MSHIYLKTTYNEEGPYGSILKKPLYCHFNNSCDILSFHDENGGILLAVEDCLENNFLEVAYKVMQGLCNEEDVESVGYDELVKCNIIKEIKE